MAVSLRREQPVELLIDTLAFGGAGLGKYTDEDGRARATFVHNVVPGDRILAALTKIKPSYLEARLLKVVEPSPLRISPRCAHFELCGGCRWQSLDYADQLRFKEEQVFDTLQHIGGFSSEFLEGIRRPIAGCEDPWNYRNKMEFSFGTDAGGAVQLGLHLPERRYDVFDLTECFLPSSVFALVVKEVRAWVHGEGLTVHHGRFNKGLLKNLMVREGKNTGELMVVLITSAEEFPEGALERLTERLTAVAPALTSLQVMQQITQRGQKTRRTSRVVGGAPVIHETLQLKTERKLEFEISPESFFQPNTRQAQVLYELALTLAELDGTQTVYDLYCGTGTIGLFCAGSAKEVIGIEVVEEAVVNARDNARKNGIENARFLVGDVGKELARAADVPLPEVVMVDPPRAGLSPDTVPRVAELGAERIVYVSCNPSTLARDLALFATHGYTADAIQPVDMFPHTAHIETVARLRRLG